MNESALPIMNDFASQNMNEPAGYSVIRFAKLAFD